MADEPRRDPMEARVITVSREALRADLAEMRGDIGKDMAELELRMTRQLGEMMARKADLVMHQSLEARFNDLAREAVRRDGPGWRDMQEDLEEVKRTVDARQAVVDDFLDLKRQFRSDTELKAMIRDERTGWQGSQWTWAGRVITVLMFIIAAIGVTLALRNAQPSSEPPSSTKTSTGVVSYAASSTHG